MGELQPGTQVTPTVRLVRRIGEGGMGAVWLADHLSLHTQVVVKFMSHDVAKNEEAKARFSREAAAAAQVKSPHVVHMLDHGVTDGNIPYILMELLEGEDLAQRLALVGTLPSPDVATIVTQVAKALAKAHSAGILHRDIKPDNIFLCDQEGGEIFVKLLDFGIAKSGPTLDATTRTGQLLGTPYYMSPEQIVGHPVDPRSDLYSLAVVAFEALTGERPFRGDTVGAITLAMHSGPLPLPTKIRGDLPAALDAWFTKACAKDSKERYQGAKELAAELRAALGERAPMSSRIDPSELMPAESSGKGVLVAPLSSTLSSMKTDGESAEEAPARSFAASTNEGAIVDIPVASRKPRNAGLALLAIVLATIGFLVIRSFSKPASPAEGIVTAGVADAGASAAAREGALATGPSHADSPMSSPLGGAPPSSASSAPVASIDRPHAPPRPAAARSTTSRPPKVPRKPNDDDIK